MKCDAGIKGKGPKELFDQAQVELPGGILLEIDPVGEKRPVGDVQNNPDQRLIHGNGRLAITRYSLFIAQSLFECQPKTDSQIFNRVVIVNIGIAPAS